MVSMESLYGLCTGLGTIIFILIFANYFLEGQETREKEPADAARTVKAEGKTKTKKPKKANK